MPDNIKDLAAQKETSKVRHVHRTNMESDCNKLMKERQVN